MRQLTALIVEDEYLAQQSLEALLSTYCPNVQLLGIASSVEDGIAKIHELNPQVLFLDIQLGNRSGFSLLEAFPHPAFEVIITTAHNEYAIKALRASAVDYLLKPIGTAALIQAIDRAQSKLQHPSTSSFSLIEANLKKITTLVIPDGADLHVLKLQELSQLKGDGSFTTLFSNGKKLIASKNLGHFEDILPTDDFFRCHTSYMVNRSFIKQTKGRNPMDVIMNGGEEIPVSRSRKEHFVQWLRNG